MSEKYELPQKIEYLIALKFTEEISEKQTVELATYVLNNPKAKKKYYELEGIRRLLKTSSSIIPTLRLSDQKRQVLINKFNGIIVFPFRTVASIAAAVLFTTTVGIAWYAVGSSQVTPVEVDQRTVNINNTIENKNDGAKRDNSPVVVETNILANNIVIENSVEKNGNTKLKKMKIVSVEMPKENLMADLKKTADPIVSSEKSTDLIEKKLVDSTAEVLSKELKDEKKVVENIAAVIANKMPLPKENKILNKKNSNVTLDLIEDKKEVLAVDEKKKNEKQRVFKLKREARIHADMIHSSGFFEYSISNLSSKNKKSFRITSSMNLHKLIKGKKLAFSNIIVGKNLVAKDGVYKIITNLDDLNAQLDVAKPLGNLEKDKAVEEKVKKTEDKPEEKLVKKNNIRKNVIRRRKSKGPLQFYFREVSDSLGMKKKKTTSRKRQREEAKFKDALRILYCFQRLNQAEDLPESKRSEAYKDVYDVFLNVNNFKSDKHYTQISNKIIEKMDSIQQ